jgi:hypothetical protein
MRVISLGLSAVNRFCSTDWDTAKCVKFVYKSVHVCNSCLVNQDFLSVKPVYTTGFDGKIWFGPKIKQSIDNRLGHIHYIN